MTAAKRKITILPGDGIGAEVVESALAIIQATGAPVEFEKCEAGARAFQKGIVTGIPRETIESIERTRVVLKGPLETPIGFGNRSANVTLRTLFETYGNIRPVRELPGVQTAFTGRKLDIVIVRENIEDLYAGIEYMQTPGVAEGLKLISREGCEKIVKLAFAFAIAEERKAVHCATKSNIMKLTETGRELAQRDVLCSVDVARRPLVVLTDVQEVELRLPFADLVCFHIDSLKGNTHPHNERVAKRRASRDGHQARESGQALVETALSLSLLVFTILGGADMARAFAAQMGVQNAARAGAEAWATRAATTDAQSIAYATDELGRVAGVNAAAATITVTHTTGAGGESLVNVRVQYTYRTLAPWPFVPNSLSLDKTATFRNYP